MTRRLMLAFALLLCAVLLAACGEKEEPASGAARRPAPSRSA